MGYEPRPLGTHVLGALENHTNVGTVLIESSVEKGP